MNRRKLIFAVPVFVVIISMLLFFLAITNKWFGESLNSDFGFCEALREGLIKQPANTWSNLAFIIVGLIIGYQSMKNHYGQNSNRFTKTIFFPTFFASLTVLLGPGSMALHATTTQSGGYFDMLSMYLIASFMFSYAITRFFRKGPFFFFLTFMVALLICNLIDFSRTMLFGVIGVNEIFGIFITLAACIEFLNVYVGKSRIKTKWIIVYVSVFLFSFLIWNLSLTNAVLCVPESLLQGHAIWHILDAVSVYYMYRFYTSEHESL